MTATTDRFKGLVVQSLLTPHLAAQQLIDLRLPRRWLWMALALMCVLNAIVYSLTLHLSPPTDPAAMAMIPPMFQSPFLFTIFLLGALVITVFTLTWIGQSMGGKAELGDMLVLITWMQVLRLLLQFAVLVVTLVSSYLSAILVLISSIWGIYILVGFIDQGHGFGSWIKAAGVMIFAILAMAFGLTIILSAIGFAVMGAA